MVLITDSINISYRFLTPYPFEDKEFLSRIGEKFDTTKGKSFELSPEGIKPVDDTIYKFKQSRLNYRPDNGTVGVFGSDYKEVNEAFVFVGDVLSKNMGMDLNKIKFLEIVVRGRYKPKIKPLKSMSKTYNDEFLSLSSKFFGNSKVTPMALRVCSEIGLSEDLSFRDIINWYDFRLEPMILNPSFYFWQLVYRNNDYKKTLALWSSLPDSLEKLIGEFDKV